MNRLNGNPLLTKPTWLWLLLGLLLMPFAAWQTVIPLAAWLAPIFLLRFSRTTRRALIALPLIFVAYEFGNYVSARGFGWNPLGFLGNQLFKALIWTLPYAADRMIGSRLKGWGRLFVFPSAFVGLDWIMSLLRVSSSGSPAYSQSDNLALLQIVSVTGMWGLTFLIVLCASTVNALWEHGFDWRPVRGQVAAFVGVLLAGLLLGSVRLAFAAPDSPSVQVATITSDSRLLTAVVNALGSKFYQFTDAERAAVRPSLDALLNQMLGSTETALRGGAKIVSWDEEAAFVLAEDEQSALDRAGALARQHDAYLQVSLGILTRTNTLPFLRDQSILIDPSGQVLWTYDKSRLVPFDEAFFTIAGPGILPVADTPYGRLSTAICYETYYPALIRQAGLNGVDILITPANDTRMYAASASAIDQVRAVENGVTLVRAAHGLTLITDDEGRVLGSQDYFTNDGGILLITVPTRGVTTIYGRIGDLFAYLCVVGLIFLAGWAFVRHERPAPLARPQPA
jgi:apolipoprotein N-acyltransferase